MPSLLLILGLFAALTVSVPAAAADGFAIPPGFKSEYQVVDGVRIHYLKGGNGPLVLLVHGFGQTWFEWRELMPLLARDHTVVAPDLPGLGDSEPSRTSYSGNDISEYLYKLAKTFSVSKSFDVVAHDIGIWNAYPMVATHQTDIRSAVFMEAPIPDNGLYEYPAFSSKGESLVWHFSFFAAKGGLAETLIAGREKFFLKHFIRVHEGNAVPISDAVIEEYARSYAKPGVMHAAMQYYSELNETIRMNERSFGAKLTVPILAIGGGEGFGSAQGEQISKHASHVESHVVPGCGHWLPEECGEAVNGLVVEFLHRQR